MGQLPGPGSKFNVFGSITLVTAHMKMIIIILEYYQGNSDRVALTREQLQKMDPSYSAAGQTEPAPPVRTAVKSSPGTSRADQFSASNTMSNLYSAPEGGMHFFFLVELSLFARQPIFT